MDRVQQMKEGQYMKIGVFDSGVGGITVLKEALCWLPQADYIYYSDNLHVPYGTKTKEEVYSYVEQVVKFLIDQGVDAIVIACNTATSVAVNELRQQYTLPIIGMEPAVKLALDTCKQGKILVTATPLALKEEKFKKLVQCVDKNHRVVALALPELVNFAESKDFDEKHLTQYFEEQLKAYDLDEFSGIVLGCTHFVYFRKFLRKILPQHIQIFDGNEGTIKHLKECVATEIERASQNKKPQVTFYYSGKQCEDLELLNSFLRLV